MLNTRKLFLKNYFEKNKIEEEYLNYDSFKKLFSYLSFQLRNEDIDYLLFYIFKKTENIEKLTFLDLIIE